MSTPNLNTHAEWLLPGRWRPADRRGAVWHHEMFSPPSALTSPGGEARPFRKRQQLLGRIARPSLKRSLQLIGSVRRTGSVHVESHGKRRAAATAAIPRAGGDRLIAFDVGQHLVVRISPFHTWTPEYETRRRRLAQHLPTPDFQVTDNGSVLLETWLPGLLLSQLPLEVRLAYVQKILSCYQSHVAAQGDSQPEAESVGLSVAVDQANLPRSLRNVLQEPATRYVLQLNAQVLSHRDLDPENVLVDPEAGEVTLVDLNSLGEAPVWYDVVKLADVSLRVGGARPTTHHTELVRDALRGVWDAGGMNPERVPSASGLSALWVVAWAWRKALRHGEGQTNIEQFSKLVSKKWRRELAR